MAQWRPDQSFYPSPRMAMRAPAETLAYVALFNPQPTATPDALAALLVFRRFGLAFLRTAWVNLDLVWAAALVVTGALTLAL